MSRLIAKVLIAVNTRIWYHTTSFFLQVIADHLIDNDALCTLVKTAAQKNTHHLHMIASMHRLAKTPALKMLHVFAVAQPTIKIEMEAAKLFFCLSHNNGFHAEGVK